MAESTDETRRFDVFLSYNRRDAAAALALAETLRGRSLSVWLDVWELRPGLTWQDGVGQGLAESKSCAVLIGAEGYGGWQKKEMQVSLMRQGAGYPVIPVLLPGAPERARIGDFLDLLTWVDLRNDLQDRTGIHRLIWGITGFRPEAGAEGLLPDANRNAMPHLDAVGDTQHFSAASARSSLGARQVKFDYRLYEAYVEGTKLRRRLVIYSGRKTTQFSGVAEAARAAGEEIVNVLVGKIPRGELEVRIRLDPDRSIQLTPPSAWLLYYAFPGLETLSSDPRFLASLTIRQMAWYVQPGIGRLPTNSFAERIKAVSEYLEVRHEGYRPGFLSLSGVHEGSYLVRLTPVLNQRIAVLGFPGLDEGGEGSGLSQLITTEIVQALERRPEVGTYGYLDGTPRDSIDRWSRVEIGNEILMPNDVRLIEAHLETFDTSLVSGEGRYFQRQNADIHYIVSGSYSVS